MELRTKHSSLLPRRDVVYRFAPCTPYDIEAMESWLGELAQQGLLLCRDGVWGGLVRFERARPRRVRYRLDAAPIRHSILEDPPCPTEEEREIAAAAGWQYWGRFSSFYIYRTEEPLALELNTDPKVQAMSLDLLRKETTSRTMLHLAILVMNGWKLMGMPLLTMIELGPLVGTLTLATLFWYILSAALDALQVRRLQRKLRQGTPPNHKKNWRRARVYTRCSLVLDLLAVVWLILLLYAAADETSFGRQRIPAESYSDPLPFAVTADFIPDAVYEYRDMPGNKYNTFTRKSGALAPDFIDYWEYGTLTTKEGEVLRGFLLVKYYELPNEWMAKEIARELEWMDKTNLAVKHEPMPLPDGIKADGLTGYRDVFPCVIIRQGCRVAQYEVSLHWADANGDTAEVIPPETWVPWAAAALNS